MDAGPQAWRSNIGKSGNAPIGHDQPQDAACLATNQNPLARFQKRMFISKQVSEGLTGQLAVTASQKATSGAICVDDYLVAGNDQTLVDEFEQ